MWALLKHAKKHKFNSVFFITNDKVYKKVDGLTKEYNVEMIVLDSVSGAISEFEKRRKLGIIKCDRLYYYKSAAGREIDLIFESKNDIYAIEIKNTLRPSSRDVRNLVEFSMGMKKKVKMFLFYTGGEYGSIKEVQIIPVSGLFRGQ